MRGVTILTGKLNRNKTLNKGEKMSENNPPLAPNNQQETPPGGSDRYRRFYALVTEIHSAKEIIQSQFDEVKSLYKSRMSALSKAERYLKDSREDPEQGSLFPVEFSVSEEVQEIINDPTL